MLNVSAKRVIRNEEFGFARLNRALCQTGWTGAEITVETSRHGVADQLQRLSWDRVVDDVRLLLFPKAPIDRLACSRYTIPA